MSVEDETWDRPTCAFCGEEIPYGARGEHRFGVCCKGFRKDLEPNVLKQIQYELKTQDNRCTADPIFLVQEKERIYGMNNEYTDDFVWYDTENHCEADEEEAKKLNSKKMVAYAGIDYDVWEKVWYLDKWKTVQFFFTNKAAQDYIERQSHRHKGELRVYVDSLYRNSEIKMIRDYILNLE